MDILYYHEVNNDDNYGSDSDYSLFEFTELVVFPRLVKVVCEQPNHF